MKKKTGLILLARFKRISLRLVSEVLISPTGNVESVAIGI